MATITQSRTSSQPTSGLARKAGLNSQPNNLVRGFVYLEAKGVGRDRPATNAISHRGVCAAYEAVS